VQRQYTGTAGRIENSQIATYLGYASGKGRALMDRRLYLPRCWTDDAARCQAAGVPDDVGFATKIDHARQMLCAAIDAGVPAQWATADEFYGNHRGLRRDLQARRTGYVLAVAKNHRVTRHGGITATVEHVTATLPARRWQRLSAGKGAKGERVYDWARLPILPSRRRERRIPLAAGTPPHPRRRTGLLPLLVANQHQPAHPGTRSRHPLVCRGMLPCR
jgi:SRSO17 transposase